MAFYRVRFRDYRDKVYVTHYIEHDQDKEAIAAAYHMSAHSIELSGFEVWDDERLIHRSQPSFQVKQHPRAVRMLAHRHPKTDESIRSSSYHLEDQTNFRTTVLPMKK